MISSTHRMYLRLGLAILLLGLSFLMSMVWIELPYVHYLVLMLVAFVVSPKSSSIKEAKSGRHAFFIIALLLTMSLLQHEWRVRTGMDLVDTPWWKALFHLWLLGVLLMETRKALRSEHGIEAACTR